MQDVKDTAQWDELMDFHHLKARRGKCFGSCLADKVFRHSDFMACRVQDVIDTAQLDEES